MQTVSLDLIVKLPESTFENNQYDSLMTITDKLTKMVTLILGRENWSATQWADAFFKHYYRRWGVPQKIITDRGKVFLSEFWTSIFKILRTQLLVTTAYHPQSDGQSERTNQIVEIGLRHLVNNTKSNWTTFVGEVEFAINNSRRTSLCPD
jgi:transposase InsO family protein